MARRRRPEKREILPDPKFGDEVLSKFMNRVMLDGKKSVAEGIVYGAMETVETRAKKDPLGVFHDALNNVKPGIEVRSPPRRRCDLSGAGRSAPRARPGAGDPLADHRRACAQREHDVGAPVGRTARRGATTAATRSRSAKTRTAWPKPTAPSPLPLVNVMPVPLRRTGVGNVSTYIAGEPDPSGLPTSLRKLTSWPAAIRSNVSQHRHHGAYRRRQDDDDRAHPLLHRQVLQDRRSARRHRDDGLDGAGAGARDHDHVGGDDLLLAAEEGKGTSTASTSSTRPATSTSPSRSSVRCACSTARSRASTALPASSRSPRRCGARPTSTACRGCASSTSSTAPAPNFDICVAVDHRSPRRAAGGAVPADRHRGRASRAWSIWSRTARSSGSRRALGAKFEYQDIPDDLADEAADCRSELIEMAVEQDDDVMEAYLEGNEPDVGDAQEADPQGHAQLLVRAGGVRLGVQEQGRVSRLLDAVVDYLP